MAEAETCACKAFVSLLDLEKQLSWAEYELKAAVFGVPVDRVFCRYMLASTRCWPSMASMVAEGILSSVVWDVFRADAGLVKDIVELYGTGKPTYSALMAGSGGILKMVSELSETIRIDEVVSVRFGSAEYVSETARKYTLLDAVERRFPLLPAKYYAENARYLHRNDIDLVVWIKDRLSARAEKSEAFRKIYKSMAAEFVDNHLNTAVFMK